MSHPTTTSSCRVDLSIVVRAPDLQESWINVQIIIQDIDDNYPFFETDQWNLTLGELTPVGAHFHLPEAFDLDEPKNGIRSYGLFGLDQEEEMQQGENWAVRSRSVADSLVGPPQFGLICQTAFSVSSGCSLRLILLRPLDFELRPEFAFFLIAEGMNKRDSMDLAHMKINILVKNENDHAPIFQFPRFDSRNMYKLSIPRSTREGSRLIRLRATDKDRGSAGRLVYHVDPDCGESITSNLTDLAVRNKFFRVDTLTGDITVRSALKSYPGASVKLRVCVRDHGTPPKSAHGTLNIILLQDVTEGVPRIIFKPLGGEPISGGDLIVSIPSAADSDTILGLVWIGDGGGEGAQHGTCSLKTAHTANISLQLDLVEAGLILNRRTFTMKVAKNYHFTEDFNVMRQRLTQLNWSVVCVSGAYTIESRLLLRLSLPEERRFRFISNEVRIKVEESSRPINDFYTLTTINHVGQVEYARAEPVSTTECHKFIVHRRTGQLSLPFGIDRERSEKLTCVFTAVDEVTGDGEQVGGEETKMEEFYSVTAKQRAMVTVVLTITDVNDNAPSLSPSILDYGLNITEYDSRSPNVTTSSEWIYLLNLQATDADAGANGTVLYELRDIRLTGNIFHGSPPRLPRFRLAAYSGELSVQAVDYPLLDRELIDGFVLVIKLSDIGTPFRLTGLYEVAVRLLDVNDNRPMFLDPLSETLVSKNNEDGVILLDRMPWYYSTETTSGYWTQLRAFDPDLGENRTTHFTVLDEPPYHPAVAANTVFLNAKNISLFDDGRIWVEEKLLKSGVHYAVFVRVVDGGKLRQLFSDACLHINPDPSVRNQKTATTALSQESDHLRDFSRRHASLKRHPFSLPVSFSTKGTTAASTDGAHIPSSHALLLLSGTALILAVMVCVVIACFTVRKDRRIPNTCQ
ncbi:protocadherin [Sparganum proliferum]